MDTHQLQPMLDELETDVERLKALYQQYFMGLEKLPPAVLRKKVDRAFWQLRRERMPTTGTRFKFQQILQRYNTYEQYWARTLRQIENGTFKRDVIRAAKLVGKENARSALGKAAQGTDVDRAVPSEPGKQQAWGLDENGMWDDDDARTPPQMRLVDALAARAPETPPPTVRNPAAISYPGLPSQAFASGQPRPAGFFPNGIPRPGQASPPAASPAAFANQLRSPTSPGGHAAPAAASPAAFANQLRSSPTSPVIQPHVPHHTGAPAAAHRGQPMPSPTATAANMKPPYAPSAPTHEAQRPTYPGAIPAPTVRPLLSPQELAAQMRARAGAGASGAWPSRSPAPAAAPAPSPARSEGTPPRTGEG